MVALASKNGKGHRVFVGGTEIPSSLLQARVVLRIYQSEQDKANGGEAKKRENQTPKG